MKLFPLNSSKLMNKKPVITIIMDGVGISKNDEGNALSNANTPVLDSLINGNCDFLKLYASKSNVLASSINAHGTYVGMPFDGDMGNSEVGHNALGAGQIYPQGAKLVNEAINSRSIFKGKTWKKVINNNLTHQTPLHFIGLLSDGNIHSHIDHLIAMIEEAIVDGVKIIRLHALLDGRDVGAKTAEVYLEKIEKIFSVYNNQGTDCAIASGGGRQIITMDRYDANWDMVSLGWKTHVEGEGRVFSSAIEALKTLREETNEIDQNIPPFIIAKAGEPIGKIEDDHSVIFFNFRGDRAIEISKAFDQKELPQIVRKIKPQVVFAGMMEYDGDLHIPNHYLVSPPDIQNTIGEYLAHNNISQFALSETQKYGHVTFFWNGNRSSKFSEEKEDYFEIKSDLIPFEQRPWMKAAEITDKAIEVINLKKHNVGRINYANGDMVGHTGDYNAAVIAVETVDYALGRLLCAIAKIGGVAIILADHGNCEEMYNLDQEKKAIKIEDGSLSAKTSHTLNKVPFIIYDANYNNEYTLNINKESGLANVAATTLNLLGYQAPKEYLESLITI